MTPEGNRVTSALPDFLERLSTTVTEENRKADQTIMAEEHRETPIEIPADVQAKKPTLKTSLKGPTIAGNDANAARNRSKGNFIPGRRKCGFAL